MQNCPGHGQISWSGSRWSGSPSDSCRRQTGASARITPIGRRRNTVGKRTAARGRLLTSAHLRGQMLTILIIAATALAHGTGHAPRPCDITATPSTQLTSSGRRHDGLHPARKAQTSGWYASHHAHHAPLPLRPRALARKSSARMLSYSMAYDVRAVVLVGFRQDDWYVEVRGAVAMGKPQTPPLPLRLKGFGTEP